MADYVRNYDSRTHKPVRLDSRIKYPTHKQTFSEGKMSLRTLKAIGANVRTLVWEYVTDTMDYNNEIQPNITEISEILGCPRENVSRALTHFEKEILIIEISGKRIGRHGRKFMIDPYRVNRGPASELPKKRKKWNELVEKFSEGEPIKENNVIPFPS